MRAFIAIELTDEIKSELAKIQGSFKRCGGDIKWVNPENMHLTLKFFKDLETDKVESVKEALSKLTAACSNFPISITSVGAFPNANNPRVIWVGFEEGEKDLKELFLKLDDALENAGFEKETRAFTPHLTLGRVKSLSTRGRGNGEGVTLKEALSNLTVTPVAMDVSGLSLFQSTLTPHGPIYSLLSHANFTRSYTC